MNCQQFDLYRAERLAPSGREFKSVEEIQQFVDGLRDTWWWQMWYPQVLRVEAYGRPAEMEKAGSVGSYDSIAHAGLIEMARAHWNVRVVLHELSHVLASARYGSVSHDPWFARVYLELVALVLPDAYPALYDAFTEHGIDFDIEPEERLGAARPMPPACDC